jgi:hypothetical protein
MDARVVFIIREGALTLWGQCLLLSYQRERNMTPVKTWWWKSVRIRWRDCYFDGISNERVFIPMVQVFNPLLCMVTRSVYQGGPYSDYTLFFYKNISSVTYVWVLLVRFDCKRVWIYFFRSDKFQYDPFSYLKDVSQRSISKWCILFLEIFQQNLAHLRLRWFPGQRPSRVCICFIMNHTRVVLSLYDIWQFWLCTGYFWEDFTETFSKTFSAKLPFADMKFKQKCCNYN